MAAPIKDDDLGCETCQTVLGETGFPTILDTYNHDKPMKFEQLEKSACMPGGCQCCATIHAALKAWAPPEFFDKDKRKEYHSIRIYPGGKIDSLRVEMYGFEKTTPSLEMFLKTDTVSVPTVFGTADLVSPLSSDEQTLHKASTWLQRCRKHHKLCNVPKTAFKPTRLLKLSGSIEQPGVQLVVLESEALEYMTLSYSWGQTDHRITTTSGNISERMAAIAWGSLHRTFQDAIQITMRLGQQHLWIDAFCIIQDDLLDWERESSQMGNIYAHSVLTIYAALSASVDGGIFSSRVYKYKEDVQHDKRYDREERSIEQDVTKVYFLHPSGKQIPVYIRKYSHDDTDGTDFAMSEAPLDKRGWAFQERLLSSRVLDFREAEMIWECKEVIDCECGERARMNDSPESNDYREYTRKCYETIGFGSDILFVVIPNAEDNVDALQPDTRPFWANLTVKYSLKRFTFQEDILPALSGIARRMGGLGLGRYLAGMWENQLPLSLCWEVESHARLADSYGQQRDRRLQSRYLAPSWSWASGPFPLSDPDWGHDKLMPVSEILDADCTASGCDTTGRLSFGFVTIRGKIINLKFVHAAAGIDRTRPVYSSPFQVILNLDERKSPLHAAPYAAYRLQNSAGQIYSNNSSLLSLALHPEDMKFFEEEFEMDTDFCLLNLFEDVLGCFNALFLKRSALHPDSFERLGVVFEHNRGWTSGGRMAYAILAGHFRRSPWKTVTIV